MDRLRAALVAAMVVVSASLAACGGSLDRSSSVDRGTGAGDVPTKSTPDSASSDDSASGTTDSSDKTTPTDTPAATSPSAGGASATSPDESNGGVSVDGTSPSGSGSSASASSGGVSIDGSGAAAATCSSGVLSASIVFGAGAGSAGHTTGTIVLRNASSSSCTLAGYPGVSFVDGAGNQIGVPADRDHSAAATTQTLKAGGSVGAQLTIADVGVYDASACRPTTATGLRVYPPGRTAALFIPQKLKVCQGSQHDATVRPVAAR